MDDQDKTKKKIVYPSAAVKESVKQAAKSIEKIMREGDSTPQLQKTIEQQIAPIEIEIEKSISQTAAPMPILSTPIQASHTQGSALPVPIDHVLQGLNLNALNLGEQNLKKLNSDSLRNDGEAPSAPSNASSLNIEPTTKSVTLTSPPTTAPMPVANGIIKAETLTTSATIQSIGSDNIEKKQSKQSNVKTHATNEEPLSTNNRSEALILSEMIESYVNEYSLLIIYEEAYEKFMQYGKLSYKLSFSLASFICGPLYLIYKNMSTLGVTLAQISLLMLIFVPVKLIIPMFVLIMFFHSVTGKYFTIKKFCEDITRAEFRKVSQETVLSRLASYGRPNMRDATMYAFIYLTAISIIVVYKYKYSNTDQYYLGLIAMSLVAILPLIIILLKKLRSE